MGNIDKNNSKNSLVDNQREKESQTDDKSLINPRNAPTKNEIYTNEQIKAQRNEDIAEQGYTVRDGHNPNKPNPYEKPDKNESDLEGFNDFETTDEELENPSEPYQNFNETEEVLEAIDDDDDEEENDNDFDEMEGDEHERNHADKESEK